MRLAFPIDGLLCDTDSLRQDWERRLNGDTFLSDEAFWGALTPYDDVPEFVRWLRGKDFIVMCERPKTVLSVTRGWLRSKCGLTLTKEQLIIPALKRYDCRVNGVEVFIDSSKEALENLKTETVCPVVPYLVDRTGTQGYGSLRELVENLEIA